MRKGKKEDPKDFFGDRRWMGGCGGGTERKNRCGPGNIGSDQFEVTNIKNTCRFQSLNHHLNYSLLLKTAIWWQICFENLHL